MKYFLSLTLLSLSLAACSPTQTNAVLDAVLPTGLASTYAPQNPSWVYGQFFLSPAARMQACREGAATAVAGSAALSSGEVAFISTEGRITFRNNARDTAEVCRALTLKGSALPDSVPPQGVDVYADYKTYPKQPLIVLVFADAAGQETARVPVLSSANVNRIFDRPIAGFATEYPLNIPEGVFTLAQKTAIANAASFSLLVDFGKGLETFKVTQDRLTR